jgi:hypothetical protein
MGDGSRGTTLNAVMGEGMLGIRDSDRAGSGGASLLASGRATSVGSHTAASTTTAVTLPQSSCRQGAAIGALIHADMELIW